MVCRRFAAFLCKVSSSVFSFSEKMYRERGLTFRRNNLSPSSRAQPGDPVKI